MTASAGKRFKLAVVASHPIQYQAPLFRKVAKHPDIDLAVYFCSDFGVREQRDPGFGVALKWDIPLLEGYRYSFLKNRSPFQSRWGFWRVLNPGILNELRRGHYDACLVFGYGLATNWLIFAGAAILGLPVLFLGETRHSRAGRTLRSTVKRFLLARLFQRIKAFLAIGTQSQEFYRSHGVADERVFLAPYSVDNDFFRARANELKGQEEKLKDEAGIPPGLPVILYASKMTLRKRPMDCLKAFESVQDKAVLVLVGDGEQRPVLEAYVRDRAIRNVYFQGFKNQTELPRFYALADIFVLPSSYETWGLVVNEAMCFSLPVVTTEGVAAAQDLLRHGENGFVYPVGDITALADHLRQLVSDGAMRRSMGQRSIQIISSWDHQRCVEGILKALEYGTHGAMKQPSVV